MINHFEDASSAEKCRLKFALFSYGIAIACLMIILLLVVLTFEGAIDCSALTLILNGSTLAMGGSLAFIIYMSHIEYLRSPKALEDKMTAAAFNCELRADWLLGKYLGKPSPLSQNDRERVAKHIHEATCLLIAMGANPYELPVVWSVAAKEVVEQVRSRGLWTPVPCCDAKKSDLIYGLRISRFYLSLAVRYLSQENRSWTGQDWWKFFQNEGDQIDDSSCLSCEHSTSGSR